MASCACLSGRVDDRPCQLGIAFVRTGHLGDDERLVIVLWGDLF